MGDDTRSKTVTTTLLVQLKNKDGDAFRRLHNLFVHTVTRRLARLGVAPPDIPDLTQDVFGKVFKGLEKFTPDGKAASFRRWLLTITRNAANDYHRLPRAERIDTDQLQQVPSEFLDEHENDDIAVEVHRMLESIQGDFEADNFDAFVRFWIQGEDTSSIASDLKKTESAVRESRRRVLRRLREEFFDIYGDGEWPFG